MFVAESVRFPLPAFVRLPVPLITPVRVSTIPLFTSKVPPLLAVPVPPSVTKREVVNEAVASRVPVGLMVRMLAAEPSAAGSAMLRMPALIVVPPV